MRYGRGSWRPLVAKAIPSLGRGCSGRCSVRGDPEPAGASVERAQPSVQVVDAGEEASGLRIWLRCLDDLPEAT